MTSIGRRSAVSIPPIPSRGTLSRWWEDWRADWADAFKPAHLGVDLVAALSVACIALPLSMAIALASDVDPQRGLVTAIVGGFVASIAGSSRLSVTGPAAAMAVLVGQVVDQHGVSGLVFVTLVAGLLQVMTGLTGLGSMARLVPASVVHGFTAGIGVVILIGQLPRALGLPAPDESHTFDVIKHVGSLLHHTRWQAAGLALLVAIPMLVGPRRAPKVPFAIIGVGTATVITFALDLDVVKVGTLPHLTIPPPPGVPSLATFPALFGDALAIFALGSLESLLSIASLEKLRAGEKHDPNHELVGQGLGNLAAALAGGMPVTSVIARSALNVQSGARTRRSAVLHTVFVAVALFAARPVLAAVPIAALGGVLLAVGIRMLDVKVLAELWRESRAEAGVFVVTGTVMVASDLLVGVQAGVIAACVVALYRLTRASVRIVPAHEGEPHQVLLEGTLTFLASPKLDTLTQRLRDAEVEPGCIVDARHLDSIDGTAAERLCEAMRALTERGGKLVLMSPNASVESALVMRMPNGASIAHTDGDADKRLGRNRRSTARRRIAEGLARFQRDVKPMLSPLHTRLAAGQAPHTMLITCADSRVVPSLIMGSLPGEVFVVRNIGALLPPHGSDTLNDEGAALEYAIRVLGVRNVVVCGHAGCGAMTALCGGAIPDGLSALSHWVEGARSISGIVEPSNDVSTATRKAVLKQLENLKSYPLVREGIAQGEVSISGWYYDVEEAEVSAWDSESAHWDVLT